MDLAPKPAEEECFISVPSDAVCNSGSDDEPQQRLTRRTRYEAIAWAATLAWACVATALAIIGFTGRGLAALPAANTGEVLQLDAEWPKNPPCFYPLFKAELRHARYFDLTHEMSPGIPVWPGFSSASIAASVAGQDMEGFIQAGEAFTYGHQGFEADKYELSTDQYGTQLDPPAHWNEFGATMSDLPPTVSLRPLVIIDVHAKVAKDPGYHATVQDAKDWESWLEEEIPEGAVVMIRSDWSKGWESYKSRGLPTTFPGVSLELLKWLHHERHILFHGHEPLDTDMSASLEGEAWLMHNNFAQAEGVTNLDQVPKAGCLVSIGFAKFAGGLGGYARYVAVCPPSSTKAGVSVDEVPAAPLPKSAHPLRRDKQGVMRPTPGAAPTEYCKVSDAEPLGCNSSTPVWKGSS
mmetsp:Transcript_13287/g.30255  ORF Transcript_13287/g.30255 Transcript_13287/m.30255 type:complete len:408 (-) Transcript_13287:93-1316(-)